MSDDPTQDMPGSRSFEERVFARFDAQDARLTALEEKVDSRLRETRPIWEAIQARLEKVEGDLAYVKGNVKEIKYVLKAMHKDIIRARGEQEELDERVDELNERVEKLESQSTR